MFTLAAVAPPFVPTGKIPNFAKTFSNPFNARLATNTILVNVFHEDGHYTRYAADTAFLLEFEYVYHRIVIDDWYRRRR